MITKNNLFLGILSFILLIDILVSFNINYFYIRAILSFIFLITIPGLLIMLCFKIREIGFWEYLVYTIGLSVAFIMFGGLAVNWILPWLNITDKPLSLWPILICFNIFILILGIIAYFRNKDLKFKIQFPKFSWLDRIFIIVPMFFPVLSILGAFLLNNHGPNILTMIMLGAIAVYVFLVVLFRDKLNENVFPWALWMISLSLLLSFSLRSWYIFGGDVIKEYSVFILTKDNFLWSINNSNYTYNAMLSVLTLPTVLSIYININKQLILKLFFPLIFIVVPLLIYFISIKYFRKIICFLASFFFISQQIYFNWANFPIRQEIAFIFFGLMLLAWFTKDIKPTIKKFLFVIFGVSMVVSHYSTTYIALAIFTLTYIFTLVYKIHEYQKIKKGKLPSSQKLSFYLTGTSILLLFLSGFLWYNQVTSTANGFIDFMHDSISNLGNLFNEEVQAEEKNIIDRFLSDDVDRPQQLSNYLKDLNIEQQVREYSTRISYPSFLSQKLESSIFNKVYLIFRVLIRVMYFFLFLGLISIVYIKTRIKDIEMDYLFFLLSSFLIFILLIILPFISMQYSLLRLHQQFLIFFSVITILGATSIFKFMGYNKDILILPAIVFIIFFLYTSGFIFQLTGGTYGSFILNNDNSLDYNLYFTHKSELDSAKWIFLKTNSNIYSDLYTKIKFSISDKYSLSYKIFSEILPNIINQKIYVYSGYSNTFERIVFNRYKNSFLFYNFPTEFLNENKNKIYSNGESEIFK